MHFKNCNTSFFKGNSNWKMKNSNISLGLQKTFTNQHANICQCTKRFLPLKSALFARISRVLRSLMQTAPHLPLHCTSSLYSKCLSSCTAHLVRAPGAPTHTWWLLSASHQPWPVTDRLWYKKLTHTQEKVINEYCWTEGIKEMNTDSEYILRFCVCVCMRVHTRARVCRVGILGAIYWIFKSLPSVTAWVSQSSLRLCSTYFPEWALTLKTAILVSSVLWVCEEIKILSFVS